jgi:S-(hydroxymethyl)glutathione dehydrogenase/alcohol dehydrogenase
VRSGVLDLAPLITDRITLDGVPAAFERMERGEGARSVVVFDG